MNKILVVLPVINLWDEYTIHCMESIARQKCDVPFEVLIIDNGSTDMTVEKAHDFEGRKMPGRVHVVSNQKNNGVSGAWNQGIEWGLANGFTHIVVSNNDTRFGPFMLQGMYDRMERGGILLTSAVNVIREVVVPDDIDGEEHPVNHKADTEAPHPDFACFMVTQKTIDEVGWFDEEFFPAFFEDNDYHWRCKLAGGDNAAIANTKAVFIHYGSRTQNQAQSGPIVPGEKFRQNEQYFIRKWGGPTGHEQYSKPFNDESKDHKYAKRNK